MSTKRQTKQTRYDADLHRKVKLLSAETGIAMSKLNDAFIEYIFRHDFLAEVLKLAKKLKQ
jgi:hypothetical protein